MCFITISQNANQGHAFNNQQILAMNMIPDSLFAYTNTKDAFNNKNNTSELSFTDDAVCRCECDQPCQNAHESSSFEEDIFDVLGPLPEEEEESVLQKPTIHHQQLSNNSQANQSYFANYYQDQPVEMVLSKDDEIFIPTCGYEEYPIVEPQAEYLPVQEKIEYNYYGYESPRIKAQYVEHSLLVPDSDLNAINCGDNYPGMRKYSFASEKLQSAETLLNYYDEESLNNQDQSDKLDKLTETHETENKENLIMAKISNSNKKNVVKNLMSAFKRFISDLQSDANQLQENSIEAHSMKQLHSKISNLKQPQSCGGYEMDIEKERNIVIKIFNGSKPKPDSIDEMGKKFKRYISSKQFNHYTIRLLVQHPNYGDIFRYFIESHALNWLNHSKVDDPEAHRVMIEFLQFAFEDISIIDKLKKHEKRKAIFQ